MIAKDAFHIISVWAVSQVKNVHCPVFTSSLLSFNVSELHQDIKFKLESATEFNFYPLEVVGRCRVDK